MKDLYTSLSKTHASLYVIVTAFNGFFQRQKVKILSAQDLRESTKLLKLRALDSDSKI